MADVTGTGLVADYLRGLTPVRGELYASSGTITTPTTATGFTGFTEGSISGSPFITSDVADVTNDHLIIGTPGDGVYFVSLTASFTGSTGATCTCYVYKDGSTATHIGFERKLGSTDVGSAAGAGIYSFAAADEPQIKCTATSGDIDFDVVNLTIYRLN